MQILVAHRCAFRVLFCEIRENALKKAHMCPCALNDPEASGRFPIQEVASFFQKKLFPVSEYVWGPPETRQRGNRRKGPLLLHEGAFLPVSEFVVYGGSRVARLM